MANSFRIDRLSLRPFLAHGDTTLDLSTGSVYNIIGPYGSGKTSLGQAIRWCLEGACDREVGKPRVEVDARVGDALLQFHRTATSSSHGTKQAVFAALGIREGTRSAKDDITLLEVLTKPRRYAESPADVRLRFLDRTLVDPLTDEALRAAGVEDAETRRRAMVNPKSALQYAEDQRRQAERDATAAAASVPEDREVALNGTPTLLSAIDPAAVRERMRPGREKRDLAVAKIGAMRASLSRDTDAERRVLEESVSEAKKSEAEAEAAFKTYIAGPKSEELSRLTRAGREAEMGAAEIRKQIEAEEKKASKCEKCGQPVASKDLPGMREALETAIDAARKAESGIQRLQSESQVARGRLESARAATQRADKALAAHAPAERADPAAIQKAEEAVRRFDENAAAVEAVLGEATAYHAAVAAVARAEEARVRGLEDAARWARESDAMRRLVESRGSGAIPALRAKVEALAGVVKVEASVDDEGAPTLGGREWRALSDGEQFMASVLVGASISALSGFRFLFVDGMGTLDSVARVDVLRLALSLTESKALEQVFLVYLSESLRWCDGCGRKSESKADRSCAVCGGKTRLRAASGKWAGVVRFFEAVGIGEFKEVEG